MLLKLILKSEDNLSFILNTENKIVKNDLKTTSYAQP